MTERRFGIVMQVPSFPFAAFCLLVDRNHLHLELLHFIDGMRRHLPQKNLLYTMGTLSDSMASISPSSSSINPSAKVWLSIR